MTFDAEVLKKHIPFYLAAEDQRALVAQLAAFSDGKSLNYFLGAFDDAWSSDMLQGDGWPGFQLYLFGTGEPRRVRGIVLSNSCDVDPSNKRDLPGRVVFAPLAKLATYQSLLDSSGISQQQIESKISSIKAQKTTNIFYLPRGGPLQEDYIARLDDLHSMPLKAHSEKQKLFTLSMVGFYIFVLKLSFHFCRLQESVARG